MAGLPWTTRSTVAATLLPLAAVNPGSGQIRTPSTHPRCFCISSRPDATDKILLPPQFSLVREDDEPPATVRRRPLGQEGERAAPVGDRRKERRAAPTEKREGRRGGQPRWGREKEGEEASPGAGGREVCRIELVSASSASEHRSNLHQMQRKLESPGDHLIVSQDFRLQVKLVIFSIRVTLS